MGDVSPLLSATTTDIGDGAVECTFDFASRKTSITYSLSDLAELPGPERKRAKAIMKRAVQAQLRRGGQPTVPSPYMIHAHKTLMAVHRLLMRDLPSKGWPAFATLDAACRFVGGRIAGSPEETRIIARLLLKGRRRPRQAAFATNAVAGFTGLEADTIRRLIRD
jgi:hypothetical protein